MKTNTIFSSAILAAGILAMGIALSASAADAAHTGSVTLHLQYVHGVLKNGNADPAHDADCTKQLSDRNSQFVGMPVVTNYSIEPRMMSAKSQFPSPQSDQQLELTVKMNPLGLLGIYSFGALRPAELPDSYVLFSISEQFSNAVSTFLIINPDLAYNCLISSSKTPFKNADSIKFGVDESAN